MQFFFFSAIHTPCFAIFLFFYVGTNKRNLAHHTELAVSMLYVCHFSALKLLQNEVNGRDIQFIQSNSVFQFSFLVRRIFWENLVQNVSTTQHHLSPIHANTHFNHLDFHYHRFLFSLLKLLLAAQPWTKINSLPCLHYKIAILAAFQSHISNFIV